jgi:hypothetical protein
VTAVSTAVLVWFAERTLNLDRLAVLLVGSALTAALAAPVGYLRSPNRRDAAVALFMGIVSAVLLAFVSLVWILLVRPMLLNDTWD